MPLYDGAEELIRANLECIREGGKAPLVAIGKLTEAQAKAINERRALKDLAPIEREVVFIGRHILSESDCQRWIFDRGCH